MQATKAEGLLTATDVAQEIVRLFDAGPASGLRIKVHGEDGALTSQSESAFRELLHSLRLYHPEGGLEVPVPDAATIRRALAVLTVERQQKRLLDRLLTRLGRRLVDPLGALLETATDEALLGQLHDLREVFLRQVAAVPLTHETQQMLADDLQKLMTDDYLRLLAENEVRVQRPQATRLAQQILRALGTTLHQAFRCWPENADRIASEVAAKLRERSGERVPLKEMPPLLKSEVVAALERFLWEETAAELTEQVAQLYGEAKTILKTPPEPLRREDYRPLAEACWELISEAC